jgi:hypothetical protein
MKKYNKNQVSVLLGVCIIPQIIAETKDYYNNQEDVAIKEFYKSNLYDKLQNPATGLWHLSPKTLAGMFLSEVKGEGLEFPEEQS